MVLSRLKGFEEADVRLEQYKTDSETAAEVLWFLHMNKQIENKTVADLGCGNGVLGIGCMLLGSRKVYFVDKDENVLKIARENFRKLKLRSCVFVGKDVSEFSEKVDLVIENPPFGVQRKHADRAFLDTAMKISDVIYSLHKIESENFLKKYCENFEVKRVFELDFLLRKTLKFHKRERHYVNVGVFEMNRKVVE